MSIADRHELVSQIGEELNAAVASADEGQANGATQPQGSGVHGTDEVKWARIQG
jgi:hypothetical protein